MEYGQDQQQHPTVHSERVSRGRVRGSDLTHDPLSFLIIFKKNIRISVSCMQDFFKHPKIRRSEATAMDFF